MYCCKILIKYGKCLNINWDKLKMYVVNKRSIKK